MTARAQTIHGTTAKPTGTCYERSAIEDWLKTKHIDPMTGDTLSESKRSF